MLGLAKSFSSIRDATLNGSRNVSNNSRAGTSSPKSPTQSPDLRLGSSSSSGTFKNMSPAGQATIKARPVSLAVSSSGRGSEELHFLAVSAQITEVSYMISDIQTRIFEIQELRHQSASSTASTSANEPMSSESSSAVIDRALMTLDEKLEKVSNMIQSIDDVLEPVFRSGRTPTQASWPAEDDGDERPEVLVMRKHHEMTKAWDDVQNEADVLKEELREDKWLLVFRTVSSQADDMMSSLEKAVTQCHDFIWQARRPDVVEQSSSSLLSPGRASVNLDTFNAILQSYESKKKYYVPATTKVISVIDKGMRERATKNGECLRRHGEMRARWRNLRDRMGRIDTEMEGVRSMLADRDTRDSSDEGSMASRLTAKSKLSTGVVSTTSSKAPRHQQSNNAISRSISPFRRLAARMGVGGTTPPGSSKEQKSPPSGSDLTPQLRKRASYFSLRPSEPETPEPRRKGLLSTPPKEGPMSLTPPDLPKQRWNSSTRVQHEPPGGTPTIKATPTRRRPSVSGTPVSLSASTPTTTRRAPGASRPPSRIASTSSVPHPHGGGPPTTPSRHPPRASTPTTHSKKRSISHSRQHTPPPPVPPLPASHIPMRAITPAATPRPRPSSPQSHIPAPAIPRATTPLHHMFGGAPDDDPDNPPTSLMQRAFSPTFSATSGSGDRSVSRRTSSSRIPIPTLQVTSQPPSPTPSAGIASHSPGSAASSAVRPQTPESTLRARAHQMPFYQTPTATRPGHTARSASKAPPSSFRDSVTPSGRTTPSRPSSRTAVHDRSAVFTPSLEQNPVPQYAPVGPKDPLDQEVAGIVNKLAHGFLIERVDPIPKVPPPGGEYKAQYAISNSFGRKVITCRLVVINRSVGRVGGEAQTRKVMVRVGGGWQDLDIYLLNRQAGTF